MTAVPGTLTVMGMSRIILSIAGVVLAIWLVFTVLGSLLSLLKMFLFIGFIAVLGYLAVLLISKSSRRS
jgi:uncharacterized membrane protein